jgi:DNA-binding winged helix-turn-helix (wHTH) protein
MPEPLYYEFDDFRIDTMKRVLLRYNERVKIPPKAFSILLMLVEKNGEPISKEEIIRSVWPGDAVVGDNTFNVTLWAARRALGDSGRDPKYIAATPEGYRFIATIRHLQDENTTPVNQNQEISPPPSQQAIAPEPSFESEPSAIPEMLNAGPGLLGNHIWHLFTACVLYASLYGIALFVETAYQFDRYKALVLRISPLAFTWILLTSIAGLVVDQKRTIKGRADGLGLSLLVFIVAGGILYGALSPFLPSVPVTEAQFQTHTAQAVYLKEVCYFCILATLFLIIPFHFVVTMERELSQGKQESVIAILTSNARSVLPTGTFYLKPQILGFFLALITLWALIVRAYVLDQLVPGPYMNLFMGVYYVRLLLFLGLPAYCLAWYFRAINELKRECLEDRQLATVE